MDQVEPITLPAPRLLLLEYGGGRLGTDGWLRLDPPPITLPAATLRFGNHHLGTWVVDHVESTIDSEDRPLDLATLRRIVAPPDREPIDDETAAWIKKHRDQYTAVGGDDWMALDNLLNDYRDHRATGTPLDQPIQGPHAEEA